MTNKTEKHRDEPVASEEERKHRAKEWLKNRWSQDHPNEGHIKQLADYEAFLRLIATGSFNSAAEAQAIAWHALATPPEKHRHTAEVEALRKALEPFAEIADWYDGKEADNFEILSDYPHGFPFAKGALSLAKFRAARAALATQHTAEDAQADSFKDRLLRQALADAEAKVDELRATLATQPTPTTAEKP